MEAEAKIDMDLSGEPPANDRNPNREMPATSEHTQHAPIFMPNTNFHSLANVLEVRQNSTFGRHIVATCDIAVGQTIAMEKLFAGSISTADDELPQQQAYCLTCFRTDANFIPCPDCTIAMFCNRSCYDANDIHRFECQSIFHLLVNPSIKTIIQMVFIAMKNFSNVDRLIEFVESILNTSSDDPTDLVNTAFPSYGLLLKLQCCPRPSDIKRIYEAFEFMMTLPAVASYFVSDSSRRFLMHLLTHQLGIFRKNGFSAYIGWTQSLLCEYIHDSLSLFNHSCAPNAFLSHQNMIGRLTTLRPIKAGDQIYISYLGGISGETRRKRQQALQEGWQFDCACDRCKPVAKRSTQLENQRNMNADASFKYYKDHHADATLPPGNEKRNHLKNVCEQILNKYGSIWSDDLKNIAECFTTIIGPNQ